MCFASPKDEHISTMKNNLSDIGEFGLIGKIRKSIKPNSSVIKGIGDDTAVVKVSANKYLLLTTDMLIENVHFTKDMSAIDIGRKSVACSISDIAAMGGIPKHILVSFGAPAKTSFDFTLKIFWYLISIVFVIGIWFAEIRIFRIKKIPFYSDLRDLFTASVFKRN